jgi:hypothetical protein
VVCGVAAGQQILAEFGRPPNREQGGTVVWTFSTLEHALRKAPAGLPGISTC